MSVVRWEDPPPARRGDRSMDGDRDHVGIAAELRANPGRWALILEGHCGISGHSFRIRLGRLAAYQPAGAFEALTRYPSDETARVRVYARYVGEAKP